MANPNIKIMHKFKTTDRDFTIAACGRSVRGNQVTYNNSEITCKNCLTAINKRINEDSANE